MQFDILATLIPSWHCVSLCLAKTWFSQICSWRHFRTMSRSTLTNTNSKFALTSYSQRYILWNTQDCTTKILYRMLWIILVCYYKMWSFYFDVFYMINEQKVKENKEKWQEHLFFRTRCINRCFYYNRHSLNNLKKFKVILVVHIKCKRKTELQ